MSFSDETLMAYADGELDAATRAQIEAALATDADLAQRIARQRQLRARLQGGAAAAHAGAALVVVAVGRDGRQSAVGCARCGAVACADGRSDHHPPR